MSSNKMRGHRWHTWDEAMPAQLVVPSFSCQSRAEGGEGNRSCSQRGSGDLTGNLGQLIYNRSGSMKHLGETQQHLAGGSHASQISQVTKCGACGGGVKESVLYEGQKSEGSWVFAGEEAAPGTAALFCQCH